MPDAGELQWVDIDEFGGIWNTPGSPAQSRSGSVAGFIDGVNAPQGTATDSSYSCVPGPGGKGLIPGPGYIASADLQQDVANFADANKLPPYKCLGAAAIGGTGNFYQIALAMWYIDNTGVGRWKLMLHPDGGSTAILGRTVNVGVSVGTRGSTLAWTRMDTAAPYTAAGKVVLAYNASIFESGVYPDPTAPAVNAAVAFATIGRVIAHQNRVLLLQQDAQSIGGTTVTADGEKIRFTDPVNSNVMGAQDQIFYPEYFSGYGAWGSLSAGSLLMIKALGGAILVEGDVASPRLTYLPGVRPTGAICSLTTQNELGLCYATEDGIYAWSGGASSQKISPQLEARMWENNQTLSLVPNSFLDSVRVQLYTVGEFMLCSGNWMMHIPSKTWMRIANPDSEQFIWYAHAANTTGSTAKFGNFYAIYPQGVLSSGTVYTFGFKFSTQMFSQQWYYEMHPISLTQNADVEVTELVLEAQASVTTAASPTQTIVWTLTSPTGATQTGTATITATGKPQRIRIPVEMVGDAVQLSLLGSSSIASCPAPMLHRVRIGYREHNLAPVQ